MTAGPEAPRGRERLAAYALLAGLGAAIYANALPTAFQYDDKVEIALNRVLRDPWDHLGLVWGYNPFRFLLMLTFAFDLAVSGGDPRWFHAVNVAVHVLNGTLAWHLLRRVLPRVAPGVAGPSGWPGIRPLAHFGAAAFVAHPLAVESVTYVSGRSESLAATFVLAALLLWDRLLGAGEADPEGDAAWRAGVARVNGALLYLLLAAVALGTPLVASVRSGSLTPERGLLIALAGAAAALAVPMLRGGLDRLWASLRSVLSGPGRRRTALLAATFAAYLLGCVTKEVAAVLPALLFSWELCTRRGGRLPAMAPTLRGPLFPFLGIPLTLLAFRYAWYGAIGSPVTPRPVGVNLLTQAEVLWRYAALYAWPGPLSVYHDHPEATRLADPLTLAAVTGIAALVALAIRARSRVPWLALPLLLAGFGLAPSSSVFALKETMAEHRAYAAHFAFALLAAASLGLGARALASRIGRATAGRLALAASLALVAAWGARGHAYNRAWATEESLWRRAVELNPGAGEAWYQLGDLARYRRDWKEAEHAYRECLRARPEYVAAWNNLGLVFALQERYDEAARHFQRALGLQPCYTQALNNLGKVYSAKGQPTEAAFVHQQVLKACDPSNYLAERFLGDLYYGPLDDPTRALDHYQRAYHLDPLYPQTEVIKARMLELSW